MTHINHIWEPSFRSKDCSQIMPTKFSEKDSTPKFVQLPVEMFLILYSFIDTGGYSTTINLFCLGNVAKQLKCKPNSIIFL